MKTIFNSWWGNKSCRCSTLCSQNILTAINISSMFKLFTWVIAVSLVLSSQIVYASSGDPSSRGVQPIFVEGNNTCQQLLPGIDGLIEYKLEPVTDGTFGDDMLEVVIDQQPGAKTFSWDQGDSPVIMQAIFVKGGPDGNLYNYFTDGLLYQDDALLHAPVGKNGRYYGLSHISFCYTPGVPDIKITKTCTFGDVVNGNTLKYNYKLTVENTGDFALYDVVATDTTAVDNDMAAGDHVFNLAMLAVGQTQEFNGSFIIDQNGITNYAEVSAALETGGGVAVSDNADWECPSQNIPGSLSLEKDCSVVVVNRFEDTGINEYGLQVNYSGSVCNTSNVTIDGIVVIDNKDSNPIQVGMLAPAECYDFTGNYEPIPGDGEGLPLPGEEVRAFTDTVDASGETIFGNVVVEAITASAECTLCPTCPEPVNCPE
ncbi:TPA: hypothetical protein ACVOYN_004056 [Vibrio diabolicus]